MVDHIKPHRGDRDNIFGIEATTRRFASGAMTRRRPNMMVVSEESILKMRRNDAFFLYFHISSLGWGREKVLRYGVENRLRSRP